MALSDMIELLPEDYYVKSVRPLFCNMIQKIKTDYVLKSTLELVVNKCDYSISRKMYKKTIEDMHSITYILLDSNSKYFYEDVYVKASKEEQELIEILRDVLQQFVMILKTTEEPKQAEAKVEQLDLRNGYVPEKIKLGEQRNFRDGYVRQTY